MPSLNRFPLLGLWARECARRIGYKEADAEALGHAYAVLYAIRANTPSRTRGKGKQGGEPAAPKETPEGVELLEFGGDKLEVTQDANGHVVGQVGGQDPQTPASYRYKVKSKFPAGYYDKLQKAFRDALKPLTPRKLDSRLVYNLYDQWKKQCASGRLVDLDKLVQWCEERAKGPG
jgi:hypothetical protein